MVPLDGVLVGAIEHTPGGRRLNHSSAISRGDTVGVASPMNVNLLIDAIVRQTTVLIAQLATAGGARAPLASIANQVFLELVRELDSQGVSRKVGADMFGLGLRSYQRKIQRLGESSTDRGRTLWEAVFHFLDAQKIATRNQVFTRFHQDDDVLVRGVLHDLTESGLVFCSGTGDGTVYRMATGEDLAHVRASGSHERDASGDAMLWAVVYREGPLTRAEIGHRLSLDPRVIDASLERLLQAGRIDRDAQGYVCHELVVPYGSPSGWEAAVFDHFQSVVKTICCKLRLDQPPDAKDAVGGSTYTFVVWEGHPLEEEVLRGLARYRQQGDNLRERVDAYNARHGVPKRHRKIIGYGGQCIIEEECEETVG